MTEQEKIKYAYECMVKNNPDEAVKQLLLKDKMIINKRRTITKSIEHIETNYDFVFDEQVQQDSLIVIASKINEIIDKVNGE